MFTRVRPPASHTMNQINYYADWYTWSPTFRAWLSRAEEELRKLIRPPLLRIPELTEYNDTFSWQTKKIRDQTLRKTFLNFVSRLNELKLPTKLMLFDGLIDEHLSSKQLHAVLALIRGAMVELLNDDCAAMYTPLGKVGKNEGKFPIHADLYIARALLNVFDEVPSDGSGASLFLPVSILRKLLKNVRNLPNSVAAEIELVFEEETGNDRFRALYDLLHGQHEWVKGLESQIDDHQFSIVLSRGQGYLLNDRTWLHGREAPTGGVSLNRVHRLVFNVQPVLLYKRKSETIRSVRADRS